MTERENEAAKEPQDRESKGTGAMERDFQYRHEWKHEINTADMIAIRQRMRAVAKPDPHTTDGKYLIRSLYFDNLYDKALKEKIDGVDRREKWRVRFYNMDPSAVIHLEKKARRNGLGAKFSAGLTREEAQKLVDGDFGWMMEERAVKEESALVREFYSRILSQGLRPKVIVDYIREPFIFEAGNVRVTLDYDIRTGLYCTDFLNPDCVTIPARDAPILLEVKWDAYLPSIIRDAVQLKNRRAEAFSKYAVCRAYG